MIRSPRARIRRARSESAVLVITPSRVSHGIRPTARAFHPASRLTSIAANPRGFIKTADYAGPDRRRRELNVGSNDRRETAPADKA